MFEQFIHPIKQLTLDTSDGKAARVGSLAEILLVAEAHSKRMHHLNLSLRFRTRCDISFMQIDLQDKIAIEQYPEGYNPNDPAKAIADNVQLRIQWNGKVGKLQRASYMLACGSYTSEGNIPLSISPFLEVTDTEKRYTQDDVDDDDICIPPV